MRPTHRSPCWRRAMGRLPARSASMERAEPGFRPPALLWLPVRLEVPEGLQEDNRVHAGRPIILGLPVKGQAEGTRCKLAPVVSAMGIVRGGQVCMARPPRL